MNFRLYSYWEFIVGLN